MSQDRKILMSGRTKKDRVFRSPGTYQCNHYPFILIVVSEMIHKERKGRWIPNEDSYE